MLLTSWLRELYRGRVRAHSRAARRSNGSARSLVPSLMALESRVLLSNYTVTNTNDSGAGSLRYEVGLANSDGKADTITFDSTVFATAKTITLTSGQIDLNDVKGLSIIAPAAGVTINGNNASRVFKVASGSAGNFTGLTMTGGSTGSFGGGLYVAGTATLTNCTVTGNTATNSGGGVEVFGQLTLVNSTISNNTSNKNGGGIEVVFGASCKMTNSTISGNTCSSYGGGVYSNGSLGFNNSTVSGNHTSKNGGGVYINDGQADLTNLTISGNSAGRYGGGLNFWYGKATLTNVTISGNSASTTGAGIYASNDIGGTLAINNSIVAGNTLTAGATDDIQGTLTLSGSNNLIGTGGSGGLVNGSNGNKVGVANPQLGPLVNNGGSTQTIALLAGSPAIQAGLIGAGIPGTDQRGVPRVGAVDIGAYQVAFTGPLVVNTTDGGDKTVPNKLTLFEAVELANFRTSADTITFDPTVFASPQTITLTAGQLELTDSATTTITAPAAGLTISGNDASRVFAVDHSAVGNLTGLTITGGASANYGGGLYVAGTAVLTSCVVSGNTARDGGGIFAEVHSSVTLTDTTLSSNSASFGGGLFDRSSGTASTVVMTNSTVSGNSAKYGGGMFTEGTVTLTDCTVSGNTASKSGGGAFLHQGAATLTNVTFSGNNAATAAGLYNFYTATTLTNVTISGNSATTNAGGLFNYNYDSSLTLNNTIIAGNTLNGGASDVVNAGNTTGLLGSNNLIGAGGSGGLVNGTSGNIVGVANPGLAALGYYGGPTQTMALLPGSPAINAGSNTLAVDAHGNPLSSDQRGFAYVGTVDIGAFEYQGTSLVVNTTTDGAGKSAPGLLTLRQAVNLANMMPTADSITFDQTVFNTAKTITLTVGQLDINDTRGSITISAPASGLTISGNNASRVLDVESGATANFTGLTMTGGSTANGYGGGLYVAGAASLTNCLVSGNAAEDGGGIFTGPAALLTLSNTTVSNNSASNAGAGLCDFDTSVVWTIAGCTFSNNSATSGGGIYTEGTTSLSDSTLSGNTASNVGAGAVFKGGVATLTNVTISGNSAIANTGGLYDYSSKVTSNNSIIAGNTYNGSVPSDIGGNSTVVAGSNNLIGTGGSGGMVNGSSGNLVGVANPLLTPLGNYGGLTQTMALLPGSPAIDAGKNSLAVGSTDQRGEPHVGVVDIGAFESQGFTLTTVAGSTPQTTSPGAAFANPLAVTVSAKNPNEPVNGGVVTFTPPSSGPTASLSSPTAVIAGGVASVDATANSAHGTYTVSVTANGAASQTFSLSNGEAGSLIVNTTSDVVNPTDGLTSLREAIAYANTFTSSSPTITFDPTVFATLKTITLSGAQLGLTDTVEPITINAPAAGLMISGNHASRVFEIYQGASANLNGLTITGGNAGNYYGGGVYAGGTVTLANCVVTGNSAGPGGGGVDSYTGGSVTLTNTTVSNNSSYNGGGLFVGSGSSLTMMDCTVSGNTAASNGGGVDGFGTINLVNSTFSGNSASFTGGAIAIGYSNATLTNLTISGNYAQSAGGGLYDYRATITLNNTIVAGNTKSGGVSDIAGNSAVTGSNNLIGTGGSDGLVNGSNGNQVGVAKPLLAPLGNYGGSTWTMALLPGSPAIDAGNNSQALTTADQRGETYVGNVDIGAFESQGFTLTPIAGSTPQTAVVGHTFANPLGVTVTANNTVEPVNGGVVNFAVPLSGPSATLSSTSATIAGGQASVNATANLALGGFDATSSTTEGTTATFRLNNVAPLTLTGVGGTVTYIQGSSPVPVAPALVVSENLGLNIASATVVFTNVQVGDRFDFNNPFALQRSIAVSPDGTTETVTFTGISSAANYQATLRTFVAYSVATIPSTSPRTATFTVNDVLANTATGSQTITVMLVNQAPVLSGIEGSPLTYLVNYVTYQPQNITNTLSIFDADSNNLTSAKVQITSGYQNDSNSHDLLLFTPQSGLSSSFDPSSGTLTLTGSASVSNYRVALRSVLFQSSGPAVNTTPRTISFTAYDDSTPNPLASNTVTRSVNILLPPTLNGLNGTSTFIQGGSPVPVASTIGINQPAGLNEKSAIVTFTHLQPGDRFDFLNQYALQHTLTYNSDETSATLLLDGVATPAQYQATLRSIVYWNVANTPVTTPRSATFTVIAATGQQSLGGVQNFTVAPANQPPRLSGIEQTPLVYAANHPEFPPQPVTSTLLVTDPDSNNLTGATVQITSGYQNNLGGNDVLSFVNQLGISGVFNPATGTMTLSGLSSLQNYRAAFQSVMFSTSGPIIRPGSRTLTFTAFDDTTPVPLASNQVTRNVQVTTTNVSPVLSGITSPIIYTIGSSPSLIASSLQVTDADSPALFGATISFTNWQVGDRLDFYNQFALQHSFTEDLVAHRASLTITGPTSVANYQTMLRSIGFYNVAGNPAFNTRNVNIVVNDGISNSNTVTGDIYVQPF